MTKNNASVTTCTEKAYAEAVMKQFIPEGVKYENFPPRDILEDANFWRDNLEM